ncbi:transformer-2 protein homolog alpha-like [Chironomus tepperi]|uniref:transformer-2 protein homolog alpha-like n=1 Tax=Chironomus tepperi TaxID=113505 RepID=UPI00391F9042
MSRDNHLRSNERPERSTSRSISRFRNNASKSHHRSRSPPLYRSSPPLKRSRYQRERSHSIEKNGHRRGPTPTDIRRKNPDPSKVLGVFNLHVKTTEREIRDVFDRFGQIDDIIMVKDAKTRGFRGYCFIYYNKQRDATEALSQCNGIELKERMIRVDYSLSERPHSSTPGEYRGKRGGNVRGGSFRSRPYERTRYYEKHDNDRFRRQRSSERYIRKDDYRRRSREYERIPRSIDDRHRRSSRSPRERYDKH